MPPPTQEQLQDLREMIPSHVTITLGAPAIAPPIPRPPNSRMIQINILERFDLSEALHYWKQFMPLPTRWGYRGRITYSYDWYDLKPGLDFLPLQDQHPVRIIIVYIPDITKMNWNDAFINWETDFERYSEHTYSDHKWYEIDPELYGETNAN